jgi:hypothetical protein
VDTCILLNPRAYGSFYITMAVCPCYVCRTCSIMLGAMSTPTMSLA